MSDLRIVDEIRLLRVEPYEEVSREHLARQVEQLIVDRDLLRRLFHEHRAELDRLRDRLVHIYGVAESHGATVADLRSPE